MKQLFLLVLLSAAIHLSAQTTWGRVSAEQFAVRACPFDSTANAMVLIDSETISFRTAFGGIVYDVYKRIQIFNKEGFEYATVKIPYYSHDNAQVFEELEAQTITKDEAGKIQITKLKGDAFFDETDNDYFSRKKFAFANVAEGSILEFRYTLLSKGWGDLNDWMFQEQIPTLRSSVTIKVPEYFHYAPTPQGGVLLNGYKTEIYNEYMGGANINGVISYYMMMNVPALKEEAYLTTLNDYLARMTFPLRSTNYPHQKVWMFSDTWDVIVQQLMKSEYFGSHLNELIGDQLGAAKQIVQGLNTKEAKAKAICNQVAAKIKWNGSTSLYPSKRLSKTYTDGMGNSADINLLLISMLRAAGVKADPVLISTRHHGMVIRAYARNRQFNNVIAAAEVDSGTILLDAVGANNPYGQLSHDNLNGLGLRVVKKEDETEGSYKGVWMDIIPSQGSAISLTSTLVIDSTGSQKSKTIFTASDYPGVNYRQDLEKDSAKECLKKHLKISDEFDITEVLVTGQKDLDKKLKFIVDLVKKDSAETENKMLYINPFPVKFTTENPFKLNKRTYPVDYGYPLQQNIMATIVVPANYKVSELPKSVKLKLEDGSASFTFLIGQSDNNIQVNSSLKINSSQFQPEMYEDLKALYAKMINAYNSSVVLERVK